MFTSKQLVDFCISMLGMPYFYGTCVYNCTTDLLERKAKQYPTHYTSSRMSKYKDSIKKQLVCMDCIGFIKGFFWTNGGVGVKEAIGTGKKITSKYQGNGCPDKSANGMLAWCKSQGAKHGAITTLPDVPGVLLFFDGHVGVYIGGGYAVEARGFKYGVVKTKVLERGWKTWAYLPASILSYDEPIVQPVVQPIKKAENQLGERILRNGSKGDDVAELQRLLVALGYNLGAYGANKDGVDGEFGAKTTSAVKAFQQKYALEVDGEYGKQSHAKLMDITAQIEHENMPDDKMFEVRVTGSVVNIRNKPNVATGKIMRTERKNSTLKAVGVDAATGWYMLFDGNYISNEYAQHC